jgi:ADP-heptose:LPS heptosyltransferase
MLDLARAIEVKAQGLTPEIFLATEEQQAGKEELRRRFGLRKVVVIHPGCAGNTCNLPISVYADLIALVLDATNVGIILSGVSLERKKFHSQLCRFDDHPRVWNSMGEVSLRQYCGIIAASNLLLAPSTGPLHIASALGIETISPFCRKAVLCSNIWGNLGSKNIVLEPPASICERRGTGDHCDFKKSIGSSQLLEAIRRFIEG